MFAGLASFLFLVLVGAGLVGCGWVYSLQTVPENQRESYKAHLLSWLIKGAVIPWLLWCAMNMGLATWLPPYMPGISLARANGRPWFALFLTAASIGAVVIASFWTSVTLAWNTTQLSSSLEGEERARFHGLCVTAFVALIWVAGAIFFLGGPLWAGFAALAILAPIAIFTPTVIEKQRKLPSYARAVAKIKFGKYADAEQEVLRELERVEDDYEGWLMLATLYAEHFHDLPEAEQTILELCDQPSTNASQAAVALHRLADWHLKLGQNPASARRALQVICSRYPGTNVARFAQIRLRQLPISPEDLKARRTTRTIRLPALGNGLDEAQPVSERKRPSPQTLEHAQVLSRRLHLDPNDVPVREEFARMLAEQLCKPEEAINQLKLLLEMPEQPPNKQAEWWSLIAAYHLKYRNDTAQATAALQILVREFPDSVQALAARRRLELLSRAAPKTG